MSILAIIPARCGSKGIPDKNIVDINGRPLIDYSIRFAQKLKDQRLINEFVVSTDCYKIADVAERCGSKPPFLRPESISGDTAKSVDLVKHALAWFDSKHNKAFDDILLLQPTSPIRSFDKVKAAIEAYKLSNAESLISVYREDYINPLVMYSKRDSLFLTPLDERHNKGVRRQQHGTSYVRNGSVYLVKSKYIIDTGRLITDQPMFLEMSKRESINIDNAEDLEIVRCLIYD